MPTTSANMGLSIPTLNSDPGTWDTSLNASLALIDVHDHSSGRGVRIPTSGLGINADLTFAGFAATNLKAVAFATQTAYTTNNSLWVKTSDTDLYFRRGGVDNRLTVGGVLNVALVGGFTGDYSAAAAAAYYDDAAQAYRFLEAAPSPNSWSYVKAGGFDLYEHASGIANHVQLRSPAALAATYAVTFPAALPGSTLLVQVSSAGALTFSNTVASAATFSGLITASAGVTAAANQHVTVSGTGEYKHGDVVLNIPANAATGLSNCAYVSGTGSITFSAGGGMTFAIPLKQGDRIKTITYSRSGDGVADITNAQVSHWTNAGVLMAIGTTSETNPGARADTTINVTDTTLAAGDTLLFELAANAANILIYNLRVTYDRP